MASVTWRRVPVLARPEEQVALETFDLWLQNAGAGSLLLFGPDGKPVELPETAADLLRQVIYRLSRGQAVNLLATQPDLTVKEAADLLDVSPLYLARLLDEGTIPFTKRDTYRRVRLEDVVAYKERRDADSREHLRRLACLSEELGLYDEDPDVNPLIDREAVE
ncbi:MAG: helix-turn-helix domain-containing protein [Dehalococcoidia bacterium]